MKLTEAQLPFRDRPFNVFSITNWIQMALGILVLFVIFALLRPLWERVTGVVPLLGNGAAPWPLGRAAERIEAADDPVTPVVRILQ